MGGLSKKAHQLEKIQNRYELPTLTLDGGNLLFKYEQIAPALLHQATIGAEGIIQAYNLMHYDAVGIGRNDLAAGLDFLQEQASRAQFALLSANLVRRSDRQPIFAPSLIRKLDHLTIGIIGVTGHEGRIPFQADEDAVVLPWQEVLPTRVAELSGKCDMVILLSNYATRENTEIANTLSGIHLIIQSSPRRGNSNPKLVNNTLMVQTGKEGKYLGWMLVDWQSSKSWGRRGAVKDLTVKKRELDGINGRISRIERREKKEDLAANNSYQNLLKKKEQLHATINFLQSELSDSRKSGHPPSTYENNFVVLDENLPDQPEVKKIVRAIKEEINRAGRTRAAAAAGAARKPAISLGDSPFTGWRTCAECHEPQTDFWDKTDHSVAYQTLVEEEQQFNLDCLPCHVTAEYGATRISDDQAVLLALPRELQQVGCELCHGPGKPHAVSRDPKKISRKPAAAICLRCHTPERDEEFNYENDLIRIGCPASIK